MNKKKYKNKRRMPRKQKTNNTENKVENNKTKVEKKNKLQKTTTKESDKNKTKTPPCRFGRWHFIP